MTTFVYLLQPVSGPSQKLLLYINRGSGLSEIAERLYEEQLIRSEVAFKWYSVLSGAAQAMKPGYYEIHSEESTVGIIEKFVEGPKSITITIPEGATVKDVDALLGRAGIIEPGLVLALKTADLEDDYPFLKGKKNLEGFLFPDTYQFAFQTAPKTVAKVMLGNFAKKLFPLIKDRKQWYDDLVVASLVEEEIPSFAVEDREEVAGIIAHRLALGMGLQIDATVLYVRCGGASIVCIDKSLSREDFKNSSSYNTYVHAGLPETPIANPGVAAVKAVLADKKTKNLYYLSDQKSGKTIFSTTFDEHDERRAKYLR